MVIAGHQPGLRRKTADAQLDPRGHSLSVVPQARTDAAQVEEATEPTVADGVAVIRHLRRVDPQPIGAEKVVVDGQYLEARDASFAPIAADGVGAITVPIAAEAVRPARWAGNAGRSTCT